MHIMKAPNVFYFINIYVHSTRTFNIYESRKTLAYILSILVFICLYVVYLQA